MPEPSDLLSRRSAWVVLAAALVAPPLLAGFASAADGPHGYILGSPGLPQRANLTLAYEASAATTISGELTLDGVLVGSYTRSVPAGNHTFTVNTTDPTNMPGGHRTLRATFNDGATLVEDSRPVYHPGPMVWLTSTSDKLRQQDEIGVAYFAGNGDVSVVVELGGIVIATHDFSAGAYQNNWSAVLGVQVPAGIEPGGKTLRATFSYDIGNGSWVDSLSVYYTGPDEAATVAPEPTPILPGVVRNIAAEDKVIWGVIGDYDLLKRAGPEGATVRSSPNATGTSGPGSVGREPITISGPVDPDLGLVRGSFTIMLAAADASERTDARGVHQFDASGVLDAGECTAYAIGTGFIQTPTAQRVLEAQGNGVSFELYDRAFVLLQGPAPLLAVVDVVGDAYDIVRICSERDGAAFEVHATQTAIFEDAFGASATGIDPPPLRLAIGLATIGIAALGAIVVDRRWPFLLAPLYARIAPHRALEHPMRRRIVDMVTAEPGITIGDVQRRLALSNGVIAHHVHTLERTQHIVSMEDGQLRRLYPVGVRGTTQGALSERIVAAVSPSAPIRAADLARDLGVSRQALHYHIAALERAGTIRVEKRGRDTLLYAADTPTPPGPGHAQA